VRVESEVLAAEAAGFELLSVFEARVQGQESMGYGYTEGKSDIPCGTEAGFRGIGLSGKRDEARIKNRIVSPLVKPQRRASCRLILKL
jgi:hypothetical protein